MSQGFKPLTLYALLFLLFLYGPMLLLLLFSFNDSTFAIFPITGLTLRHYVEMGSNAALIAALRSSLLVAVVASLAATALGLPLAIILTRRLLPASGALLGIVMLPLVVPTLVFAVGFLVILVRFLDFGLSLAAVSIAHVFICMPFAVVVLMSALDGLDRSLEEASRDLGETAFGTLLRVTLPLILPGLVSSLLLCFITSFDEFVLAFFLSGTSPTLPVYLFSQLRFPNNLPALLALSSMILILSSLMVVAVEVIRHRWQARMRFSQADL